MPRRKIDAFSFPDTNAVKDFTAVINRCDIGNDRIICADDIETQIGRLDDIDNSYESEYDKTTYQYGLE